MYTPHANTVAWWFLSSHASYATAQAVVTQMRDCADDMENTCAQAIAQVAEETLAQLVHDHFWEDVPSAQELCTEPESSAYALQLGALLGCTI